MCIRDSTCPSQDTTAECWHASHMGRPVHTEHTQSASHTSRPHTHTVVVHTRILVSVAVRPRGKLESIVVTVLLPFTAVEQNSWHVCGFSIVLLGPSSAESNPWITCQFPRLWTPGARATQPARDPILRRGVQAVPLRAPQPRAREKTHGRRRKACKC